MKTLMHSKSSTKSVIAGKRYEIGCGGGRIPMAETKKFN